MAARVPEVRVISEPWVFCHAHSDYVTKKISLPEYERLNKSLLRVLLKDEKKSKTTHVLVKMVSLNGTAFKMYHELFPQFKLMFLTRHPFMTLKSYRWVG